MTAFDERRNQDVQKLTQLAAQSEGRVRVGSISGNPPNKIQLELHLKTAASSDYPNSVASVSKLEISLPARYPFVEPNVTITTPIHHPNVYASGRVCLGVKWLPTNGLDLLVRRLAQIVVFDPTILNEKSPANGVALNWYKGAKRRFPSSFPTDSFRLESTEQRKNVQWSNVAADAPKAIVKCPRCSASLSAPSGRRLRLTCPKCKNTFEATL